jgi:hypothetical protein
MQISIDLGDIVASIALILAIYTTVKSFKYNKIRKDVLLLEKDLNRLHLDKEKKEINLQNKANLSAKFINLGSGKLRLKIFNKGNGTARNIRLKKPEDIDIKIFDDEFPLELLEPIQSVELISIAVEGSPKKIKIKLTWDDDTGKDFEKDTIVTW